MPNHVAREAHSSACEAQRSFAQPQHIPLHKLACTAFTHAGGAAFVSTKLNSWRDVSFYSSRPTQDWVSPDTLPTYTSVSSLFAVSASHAIKYRCKHLHSLSAYWKSLTVYEKASSKIRRPKANPSCHSAHHMRATFCGLSAFRKDSSRQRY